MITEKSSHGNQTTFTSPSTISVLTVRTDKPKKRIENPPGLIVSGSRSARTSSIEYHQIMEGLVQRLAGRERIGEDGESLSMFQETIKQKGVRRIMN